MKNVWLIAGVLFLLFSCAEDKVASDQGVVILRQEYKEPGTDEPFDGERLIYNKTGNVKTKAIYMDGYPVTVIHYYPNQQQKTEIVVANKGKGEVKTHAEWHKNGQKKFEHRNNTLKEWYENGQLKAEVPYDENGDLHGIAKMWDKDGALKGQEKYEHGELVESS